MSRRTGRVIQILGKRGTLLADLARRFVSESQGSVLILAIVAGVAGGAIASAMGGMALLLHGLLFGVPDGERLSGSYTPQARDIFIWLAAGGLVIGVTNLLWKRFGDGDIHDPIEANALYGGRMAVRGSLFVAAQAVASNGVGASVGIEGGFTQLASAAGSWLGNLLSRPREDLRLLVACGTAGAIAGAFNAPFAGIAYAFELILASYSPAMLAPVVLAAVGGKYAATLTAGHGYRIAIATDLTAVSHSYYWAVGIGIASALFAIALMYGVTLLERFTSRSRIPGTIVTALGGVATGAVALVSPHVMGSGHGGIDLIFTTTLTAQTLAAIFLLKLGACVLSIGSGFRGGLFSASLFLGALLGGAAGSVVVSAGVMPQAALPGMEIVAMSAFGAAIVGTPLAMAILAAEVTGHIGLMPDVLLAVVTAALAARVLFGYSFSIWRLHVRGSPARSAADIAWSRSIPLRDVMRPDVVKLPVGITCGELLERFPPGSAKRIVLVDDDGHYGGLCDVGEIAFGAKAPSEPAVTFAHQTDEFLSATQSLEDAILWFQAHGRDAVVVVNAPGDRRVAGIVTESYVLKRYAQELERRRAS